MALLLLIFSTSITAENQLKNFTYASKDTALLTMDVYTPVHTSNIKRPAVIFVFGGGFYKGSKSEKVNAAFCKALSDSGFVVAAIDYRLGMKGNTSKGIQAYKALKKSIKMAEDDLITATGFLLSKADSIGLDTDKIFICGSSAGAVTVLQTEYELSINELNRQDLPANFKYAGVISFAGGILSDRGKPVFKSKPAATLFFHGHDDKIVNYDHRQIFNIGFFGSKSLSDIYMKSEYNYRLYDFSDIGHEISFLPMIYYQKEIVSFIRDVFSQQFKSAKIYIDNPDLPRYEWGKMSLTDLYRNKTDVE